MKMNPLVTPLYQREIDGVPGPFYVVKDQCIICGLPPEVAPTCIKFKEDRGDLGCPHYCHVYKQPETSEEYEMMFEAMAGSCVEAIRYCGTDSHILNQLKELGMAHLCDALQ